MVSARGLKIFLSLWVALALGGQPVALSQAQTRAGVASFPGHTRLVINIPSRTLWVYNGDKIVRYFPVGVGRPGFMTPLGQFSVIRKVLDPGWENPYKAKGAIRMPPGETNPLGTRWIGFLERGTGEYGMHGTDRPASVGKFSSHGCVRLKVPDAEALFDMVEVGTPVEVVYETVLIRPQGEQLRVVVYPDVFKRGMPSPETVKARILKQYPHALVDMAQLQAALLQRNERPALVGSLKSDVPPVANEAAPATTAVAPASPGTGQ